MEDIFLFFIVLACSLIFFAFPVAKIISNIGEKHAMLFSTIFEIGVYLGLVFLVNSPLIFLVPISMSLQMLLYNMSYHLVFTHQSHAQSRGREISTIGILVMIAGIVSPYLGGLIATLNFKLLFIISTVIIILSSAPLFLTRDTYEKVNFSSRSLFKKIRGKKLRGPVLSFISYGGERIIDIIIWPIMIITLVGSLEKTGLIVSVTAGLSLLTFKLIGKFSDTFENKKLIRIGTYLHSIGWFARIFVHNFLGILIVDTYKNIGLNVLHVPWAKKTYEIAMKNDYFEFIVLREIVFQLSRICTLIILIVIFSIGWYPFLLSLIFAGIVNLGYPLLNKNESMVG